MSDLPDSPATPSEPAEPRTLSPLKRQASQDPEAIADVLKASKKFRDVLLDESATAEDENDRGEGGSGENSNSTESKAVAATGDFLSKLESQVTCGICQDVFWRPLSIIPCLHSFCGSCIKLWFEKTSTCPTCRVEANSISPAHAATSLVEMFLGLPGNEDAGRSQEEKDKMDGDYMPGQKILERRKAHHVDSDDGFYDSDGYDSQLDDDDEDDFPIVPIVPCHVPCPCCVTPNAFDYSCPHPTPDPTANQESARLLHHPNPGHVTCINCSGSNPDNGEFGSTCSLCRIFVCNKRFVPMCYSNRKINPLKSSFDNSSTNVSLAFPNLFGGVRSEQKFVQDYLLAKSMTLVDLYNQFFADPEAEGAVEPRRPKFLGPALGDEKEVFDREDLVCQNCAGAFLEAALEREWPEMLKTDKVKDVLTTRVANRDPCWYGRECRTAHHNDGHASRLSHLGPNTKADAPAANIPPASRQVFTNGAAPMFDPALITFRDLNGSHVALASARIGGLRTPGKLILSQPFHTPGRFFSSFAGCSGELETFAPFPYEVLFEKEDEVKWVRSGPAGIPDGERPVVGGVDATGGDLWHAAAWVKGVRVPGMTSPTLTGARVSFGNQAWLVEDDFDILCFV
ncbi:hypothetical protein T439DRAFT_326604 [Meredithblackwellia eburnea MCA 4105]